MKTQKIFKFIYNSSWNEEELLSKFRYQIVKDTTLYCNNNFGTLKPIKIVKSFYELNNYIQAFNFKDEHYPLYYSIALALKNSYDSHKNVTKAIVFETTWEYSLDKQTFLGQYELPFDNTIYWNDKREELETYHYLWKKIK